MSCSKYQLFWTIEPREYLLWITNQNHKGSSISKGIFNLVPISTLFYFSTFEWFKFATFGTMGTFLYYTFFRSSKKRLENEKMNISPTLKASNIQRLQIWGTLFLFCKSLKLRSNWNYLHRLNYLYRQFDFDYMMSKSCFKNEIWKLLFYTEIPGVSWIQDCGEIGAVSLKVTRGTFG